MATKSQLQEQALQLEINIYSEPEGDDDPKELTKAQLVEAIEAKEAANTEADGQQTNDDEAVRQTARDADAAEVKRQADADAAAASSTTVDPADELLKRMGIDGPSAADRKLAKKHGYPIAVPGGKAYRATTSLNCGMGGGLRQAGSVIILSDAHAANKLDYLTKV